MSLLQKIKDIEEEVQPQIFRKCLDIIMAEILPRTSDGGYILERISKSFCSFSQLYGQRLIQILNFCVGEFRIIERNTLLLVL